MLGILNAQHLYGPHLCKKCWRLPGCSVWWSWLGTLGTWHRHPPQSRNPWHSQGMAGRRNQQGTLHATQHSSKHTCDGRASHTRRLSLAPPSISNGQVLRLSMRRCVSPVCMLPTAELLAEMCVAEHDMPSSMSYVRCSQNSGSRLQTAHQCTRQLMLRQHRQYRSWSKARKGCYSNLPCMC